MASGALTMCSTKPSIVPTLVEAIADCTLALGCTARRRDVQLPELTPREAAQARARGERDRQVAIVFGNERTGLENDELALCSYAVHIPSDETFPSLNLAQAVQVLAYELRTADSRQRTGAQPDSTRTEIEPLATIDQLEHFFEHLDQTLDAIDFHKGRSPVTIMKRLRKLFLRTNLEHAKCASCTASSTMRSAWRGSRKSEKKFKFATTPMAHRMCAVRRRYRDVASANTAYAKNKRAFFGYFLCTQQRK